MNKCQASQYIIKKKLNKCKMNILTIDSKIKILINLKFNV